jgi:hypothetical protein
VFEPVNKALNLQRAELSPDQLKRHRAAQRRLRSLEPRCRGIAVPFEKGQNGAKESRRPQQSI